MDQSFDDTPSVTAGTSSLVMNMYQWEIHNYQSYADLSMGKCINSPFFKIDNRSWRLEMYPNGKDAASKGHVSLYLRMLEPNAYVGARFIFTMLDNEKEIIAMTNSDEMYVFKGGAWGYGQFVNRSLLYLATKNKHLRVLCQIITEKANVYQQFMPSLTGSKMLKDFEALGCFLNREKFSDVKFIIENKEIFAHKIVLSTQSAVFAAMFEHQMKENQENVVKIEDISYAIFYKLLSFMYLDKIEITKDTASELLKASDKYGLLKLKKMCEIKISENLSIDNIMACLNLADMYSANHLKREAVNFFVSHTEKVIESPDFELLRNLNTELLKDIFYAIL